MTAERLRERAPVEAGVPIMDVDGLTKHFPAKHGTLPWTHVPQIHALDDTSFRIYPGKVTALVGESGSGKSTVARLLAKLYPPTSGHIFFHGQDITHLHGRANTLRYRSQVQMIFQDPFGSLNPVKRVEHHIARPLLLHHIVPQREVGARVRELLTTVGLVPADEFARKYPHELSGGQRQRVIVARALAVEPEVLLADEPISMLDVSIRMGILNLILDLKGKENIAFLYITHDIASARYVADEVLVMYAGQIVEKGPTDSVLQNPLHPYTKLLLSAVPSPETGLASRRIEARGEVKAVIDPPDACRFVDRCPVATDLSPCKNPPLVEVEPDHWVRCFLYPQADEAVQYAARPEKR